MVMPAGNLIGGNLVTPDVPSILTESEIAPNLITPLTGGAVVPNFGASLAAASNRAMIQTALDFGGVVQIRGPAGSICWIDSPLRIGDNTTLDVGNIEIRPTGVIGNLITTKAYVDPGATVTMSWTSGLTASVAWTGHGLTTDDFVWLNRADQGQFCGVFSIASITDANNFVVNLRRLPSTVPTGTIIGRKANKKVRLTGGIWNYNNSGGNTGTGASANAILLAGVQDLQVKNIKGKDTLKYLVSLGAVSQYEVDGAGGDNLNSDCCKVYGPAFSGRVANLFGVCGDDIFSAQTKEPPAFLAQDFCHGDVLGLDVDRIGGKTTTSAAVLYASTFGVIDGVKISNVAAVAAAGSIRIETIYTSGTNEVSNVTISGLVGAGQNHGIVIGSGANPITVKKLIVDSPTMRSTSNSGRLLAVSGTAVTGDATVRGGYLTGIESLINLGAGSTFKVIFDGTVIGTIFVVARAGASGTLDLTFRNIVFESNPGSAFLSNNAGTPTIRINAGSITIPSNPVITLTGTPTVSMEGKSIPIDVTTIQRVDGAMVYNSNAAAGTLGAAGVVTCQGTAANSWHLLADPTKTY